MLKSEEGFTLIELVVVIVILGILAATALPKFIDLSSEAQQAATDGVAGSLASGSAVNYASRSLTTSMGTAVANCSNVANTIQGGLPAGSYSITGAAISAGTAVTCTLNGPGGKTKTFVAIGIS